MSSVETFKIKGALGRLNWGENKVLPLDNEWNQTIVNVLSGYSRELITQVAEQLYEQTEVQAIIALLDEAEARKPEKERNADELANLFAVAVSVFLEAHPEMSDRDFSEILEMALLRVADQNSISAAA